jgi:hypothetical protein
LTLPGAATALRGPAKTQEHGNRVRRSSSRKAGSVKAALGRPLASAVEAVMAASTVGETASCGALRFCWADIVGNPLTVC